MLSFVQVERLHFREDADPVVRNRFCPLAWLAQYLLRNKPNSGTLERDGIQRERELKQFSAWVDIERGRREVRNRRKSHSDSD